MFLVIWAGFSTLYIKPCKPPNLLNPQQHQTSLSLTGGINKRLLLINQTVIRRPFRWKVVYSICNTGTDLDWSLDPLFFPWSANQTGSPAVNSSAASLRNVLLAAKIKCFVLIWRLVVEVVTAHNQPLCMTWHPFRQLWKTNTFFDVWVFDSFFFLVSQTTGNETQRTSKWLWRKAVLWLFWLSLW